MMNKFLDNRNIITVICLAGCLSAMSLTACGEDGQTDEAPVAETIEVIKQENSPRIEIDTSAIDAANEADTMPDATEDDSVTEESATEDIATDSEDAAVVPGAVESVSLDPSWTYADFTKINSGTAKLYRAEGNRKNVVIGVNAGHGTKGGQSVKTYCHPDKTPKVTGVTTAAGSIQAVAVSGGMSFTDGTKEATVTLQMARILRDKLLAKGYDVLMLRDDDDVQLDNVARTVIANNTSSCLISLHWDGDGLDHDKGCFYISTPGGIRNMEPVASDWEEHHELGDALIKGLKEEGCKISGKGSMAIDLTQTSYSTIPSVDIELGNQSSKHDDATLSKLADGMVAGIETLY